MGSVRLAVVGIGMVVLLGGCQAPRAANFTDDFGVDPDDYSIENDYFGGEGIQFGGFWVPAMRVRADKDDREPGGGVEFDADLHSGPGFGVTVGLGDTSTRFGAVYIQTRHNDRNSDAHANTHSLYFEVLSGISSGTRQARLSVLTGIGVGGALFDFSSVYGDSGGGAVMSRLVIGLELGEAVVLEGSFAGFAWGYPGETLGYGGFFTLGASIRF